MTVPAPPLQVTELTKRYRTLTAVDQLTVTVAAGEVVGLLGPNGAGKSTTMRVAAGVTLPSGGKVYVAGNDVVTDRVAAKLQLGYVPDVGGLFPRLTGWEHLELSARLRLLDDWVPAATTLLEQLELEEAAGQRTATYSHGMGRRLALAIALLSSPPLLLLDEPFDGVDPAGTRTVRRLIGDAAAAGAGVLVSTHLLDQVRHACDRLMVMRAGRTPVVGTAEELLAVTGTDGLEEAYLALQAAT